MPNPAPPAASPADPPAPPIHRDYRIDTIGFAGELNKQYIDDLKSDLKIDLMEMNIVVAEGELFEAALSFGKDGVTDPVKFFGLVKAGKITQKQFLACVTVNRAPAAKIVGKDVIEKMTQWTPKSPSLSVKRKSGVEVALVDAITSLSSAARTSAGAAMIAGDGQTNGER